MPTMRRAPALVLQPNKSMRPAASSTQGRVIAMRFTKITGRIWYVAMSSAKEPGWRILCQQAERKRNPR
jgi:hypothetical protein